MRSLNLVSLTVLAAIVLALRCLVIPAAESMPGAEGVRLMGKVMPRARRLLTVALIFYVGSAFARFASSDLRAPSGAREVGVRLATLVVTLVFVPLTLSPHRGIAPLVEHHRKTILTILLVLLSALLLLST